MWSNYSCLILVCLVSNGYCLPVRDETHSTNSPEVVSTVTGVPAAIDEKTAGNDVTVSTSPTSETNNDHTNPTVASTPQELNANNHLNTTEIPQNETKVNKTEVKKEKKYDGPSTILYPVCSSFLGISNRKVVKDDQLSASSTHDIKKLLEITNVTLQRLAEGNTTKSKNTTEKTSNFTITGNQTAAHDGRLGNSMGSWCASGDELDGDQHLTIDLGDVRILEGVVTAGRSDSDNWVTSYLVAHSSDKKKWYPVRKDGNEIVFKGNKDRNSIVVGSFPDRIAARYIKFTPKTFHGKLICMRVEAIGCHPDTVNVARDQPSNQSSTKHNFTSSKAVDGDFIHEFENDTCTHTHREDSPWLRIDLRRVYLVKEIFISDHERRAGRYLHDFEVRVGNSLENEGNSNPICSSMETVDPGQIKTIVCKNGTLGRYVNIRIPRENNILALCEVAVVGIAETVVKLGLEDIANSLKTGVIVDKAGKAKDVIGGLMGQLQEQLGQGLGNLQGMGMLGNLQGQGMGLLNNLQGQGLGMLNNLKGQGLGMLNNLKGQGLGMVNDLKGKGLGMVNDLKDQGMGMVNDLKGKGMGMVNDLKGKGLGMANDLKDQGMGMVNDLKGQGMGMATDLQNQGMGMVGDMQGQMNQQQDKFKKKLKEILKKGKEMLKEGQKKLDEFRKRGYIGEGKGYMDKGLKMTMDGIGFIQAKISESLSNIAGDMSQQITTLSEYDTSTVKGLLDDVNSENVRDFVLDVRPKISKLYDDMEKSANKYIKLGIKKGMEAKDEIEKEANTAANQATSLGKNVAGKATSMGKNMADKAKTVGMGAVNKIKKTGMGAVGKLKKAGMDAANKAKDTAMGAVDKVKNVGMGALSKAKSLGQGALGQGMGAFGNLKQTALGSFGQLQGQLGSLRGQLGSLQGVYSQLTGFGKELIVKAKPVQVVEMQQIGMLQNLKKLKQMEKLKEQLEEEQNEQWKTFEILSKEMTGKEEILKKNIDDLKTDDLESAVDDKLP